MLIFVSHPYANDPEGNKKKVDAICKQLVELGHMPLSPLHLFSFMENDNRRNEIMRICFELIQIADEVWIFGDSEGCRDEKGYAEYIGKPVRIMYRKLSEG